MHELTVEDPVLFVLAQWQLRLLRALEQRGHAAMDRIDAGGAAPAGGAAEQAIANLVRAARPARSHPDWETGQRLRWREPAERQDLVIQVAQLVPVAIEALVAEAPAAAA